MRISNWRRVVTEYENLSPAAKEFLTSELSAPTDYFDHSTIHTLPPQAQFEYDGRLRAAMNIRLRR